MEIEESDLMEYEDEIEEPDDELMLEMTYGFEDDDVEKLADEAVRDVDIEKFADAVYREGDDTVTIDDVYRYHKKRMNK